MGEEIPVKLYDIDIDYSRPSVLTIGSSFFVLQHIWEEVKDKIYSLFNQVVVTTPDLLREDWKLLPSGLSMFLIVFGRSVIPCGVSIACLRLL